MDCYNNVHTILYSWHTHYYQYEETFLQDFLENLEEMFLQLSIHVKHNSPELWLESRMCILGTVMNYYIDNINFVYTISDY